MLSCIFVVNVASMSGFIVCVIFRFCLSKRDTAIFNCEHAASCCSICLCLSILYCPCLGRRVLRIRIALFVNCRVERKGNHLALYTRKKTHTLLCTAYRVRPPCVLACAVMHSNYYCASAYKHGRTAFATRSRDKDLILIRTPPLLYFPPPPQIKSEIVLKHGWAKAGAPRFIQNGGTGPAWLMYFILHVICAGLDVYAERRF